MDKAAACKSVLIVDDDYSVRETLKDALEMEGFSVQVAANGKEAIELLKHVPRPCLILLDLMMPVMSGWEFLEQRRNDDVLAQIPVAVVSAAGRYIEVSKGTTTMRKPIDLFALIELVAGYCPRTLDEKGALTAA